jgi:hypothetical protein
VVRYAASEFTHQSDWSRPLGIVVVLLMGGADPEISDTEIWVPLSFAQAEWVARRISESQASGAPLVRLLLALSGRGRVTLSDLRKDPDFNDHNVSQYLLVSLLVLSVFHDKLDHRVTDLAPELDMALSSAVRYLKAWVAVGVLEQDDKTHKYRLALRWRTELDTRVVPSPAPAEQVT